MDHAVDPWLEDPPGGGLEKIADLNRFLRFRPEIKGDQVGLRGEGHDPDCGALA